MSCCGVAQAAATAAAVQTAATAVVAEGAATAAAATAVVAEGATTAAGVCLRLGLIVMLFDLSIPMLKYFGDYPGFI